MGFSRQEYRCGLPFPSPVDHILSALYLILNLLRRFNSKLSLSDSLDHFGSTLMLRKSINAEEIKEKISFKATKSSKVSMNLHIQRFRECDDVIFLQNEK